MIFDATIVIVLAFFSNTVFLNSGMYIVFIDIMLLHT